MKVKVKQFAADMEVKTNGIEFEIRKPDGSGQIGDGYVTKTGLTIETAPYRNSERPDVRSDIHNYIYFAYLAPNLVQERGGIHASEKQVALQTVAQVVRGADRTSGPTDDTLCWSQPRRSTLKNSMPHRRTEPAAVSTDVTKNGSKHHRCRRRWMSHGRSHGRPRNPPQPLRVAVILPNLSPGGAERNALTLAREWQERHCTIVVVSICAPDGSSLRDFGTVPVMSLGRNRVLGSLPSLLRAIRELEPDVIISPLFHLHPLLVLAARVSTQRPRCLLIENSLIRMKLDAMDPVRRLVMRHLLRLAYRHADLITGVSRTVSGQVDELMGTSGRVHVIANPVIPSGLARLIAVPPPHEWLKGEGRVPVILGVGRLAPVKRFDLLIRAVAILVQVCPVRLIILGEGPCRDELQWLAGALSISSVVSFPGHVAAPISWMAAADVVAVSSSYESFGNVVVESVASGTPVVAVRSPGGLEEFVGNGILTTLVPGTAEALSDALVTALSRSTPTVSDVVLGEYRVEVVADRYLELLTELCR